MLSSTGDSKRWLIKSFGFGAGFAFVIVALAGISFWYSLRPKVQKPWNRSAITASYYGVRPKENILEFDYILENNTAEDIRLTEADKVDLALKVADTNSLAGFGNDHVKLSMPVYIPTKHKTRIAIELSGYSVDVADPGANATRQERKAYSNKVAEQVALRIPNLGGFEMFISNGRMEVDMPRGW